jgi:hypothetical protein
MDQVIRGSRYQSIVYNGQLKEYQLYGNNRGYVEYERDEFNAYQNFLYKRALFGLTVYSSEELNAMHWDKKKRILKVHTRTQKVLNLWKQELSSKFVNTLFQQIFWKSQFVKDMVDTYGEDVDPEITCKMEFKEMGIQKKQIVEKLIQEKILPINFYELTEV